MRSALLGLAFLLIVWPAGSKAADTVLERVVMVSRHGVRAPIRPLNVLDSMTGRDWPKWPVGAGEMTEHGTRNLALMADFLRETYRDKGLLPVTGCPVAEAVGVWSDAADHRTRQSGEIFAEHFAPSCGLRAAHISETEPDPLFNASATDACPVSVLTRARSLASSYWQKAAELTPEETHALQTLQQILAPDACKTEGQGVCLVPRSDASVAKTNESLGAAAAVAEALYLEYAQGFPEADVGWGKAGSAETIATVMPAYERGINYMRRNPIVSARRGVLLVRTILSLLEGARPPDHAPALSSRARLIMIAGHDSNLLQSAVLMGLNWRLPFQPSLTAPDTTVAFEVWRDPTTNRQTVRVVVYAQTLEQLRHATVLDASNRPDVVPVVPDACTADGTQGCALDTFVSAVERHIAALCKS